MLALPLTLLACHGAPQTDDTGAYPDLDGDGFTADVDCNDYQQQTFPGAAELCDDLDNDCDGVADNGATTAWYRDYDGDGHGVGDPINACDAPDEGWVDLGDDCDDLDATIHPGAVELCDGINQDCDALVDEEPSDGVERFLDRDGDGYGDPDGAFVGCPSEGADEAGDCNDTDADVHPGRDEWYGDGVDNDCDGGIDNGCGEPARSWVNITRDPDPAPRNITMEQGETVLVGVFSGEGAICGLEQGGREWFTAYLAWGGDCSRPMEWSTPFELADVGPVGLCVEALTTGLHTGVGADAVAWLEDGGLGTSIGVRGTP